MVSPQSFPVLQMRMAVYYWRWKPCFRARVGSHSAPGTTYCVGVVTVPECTQAYGVLYKPGIPAQAFRYSIDEVMILIDDLRAPLTLSWHWTL